MPSKDEIKKYIKKYSENDDWSWWTIETMYVKYSALENILWKENPDTLEYFNIVKISDTKYIIEKDGKFKEIHSKPTQKEINDFYDNDLQTFTDITSNISFDENISIKEQISLLENGLSLLKIQDTEGWFFGSKAWSSKLIERLESRLNYIKEIHKEYLFFDKAIQILEHENNELFKKFSMISTFGSVSDFMKAFPSNDLEVRWFLSDLQTADSVEKYVDILKQINKNKKLKEYFDIVFNAHKNNSWMKAWKNYRLKNIPRETWLKRINTSKERQFKYGQDLSKKMITSEWIINYDNKMKEYFVNELSWATTEKWWNYPSKSILWNLVQWLIQKQWITDVTEIDLKKSLLKDLKAVPIKNFEANVINTSNPNTNW
jgi:hypothetical protein